jgi:putative flippase GtrA
MVTKILREGDAYMSVAVLATASDWLVFTALSWALPTSDVVFAQVPARLTGRIVAFMMHRNWSFRVENGLGLGTETRRFLALYVFSFCVSVGTMFVLVELLDAHRYWIKGFADILWFVVNFVVMKFYVFAGSHAA